jgi:hypothetical protein
MPLRFLVGKIETKDELEVVKGVVRKGPDYAGSATFNLAPSAHGSVRVGQEFVLLDASVT